MNFSLRPDGLLERVALWLNLAPTPIAYSFFGMMGARATMAGVRLGLFAELARAPATRTELAARLRLDEGGTQRLLDSLVTLELVRRLRGERYALDRRAARWLDPKSPRYVGSFLEFNYTQWDWWSKLEDSVRTGKGIEIHGFPPDDPRWRDYMTAMFELARLAGPEVARAVTLPPKPKRLLDLAGGHGWFAAELCMRHPGLEATVMDLPGSVRAGREIIAARGLSDRVRHVEGDLFKDPLGGPYDGALCFQIIHHLTTEQNQALLERVRDSLAPGGTVAVLDYFLPDSGPPEASSALLGLHFFVTSTATTYPLEDVRGWLRKAGFESPRATAIRRLPLQTVVVARKPRSG